MKPTKNRYHCIAAKRTKMLFESESQANNFIRFNAEEMEELGGKVPVRSYYCPLCMGWHVTSNPNAEYFENYKSYAEKRLEKDLKEQREKKMEKRMALYRKGQTLLSESSFYEAADSFLQGFNQCRTLTECREECGLMLKAAFDAECSLLSEILNNQAEYEFDIRKEQSLRILKRLDKAASKWDEDYSRYFEVFRGIIGKFQTAKELGVEVDLGKADDIPATDTEEAAEKRARQKLMKREKKIDELEMRIEIIRGNLAAGQALEARRVFKECVKTVKNLSAYADCKEKILVVIDKLFEVDKEIVLAEGSKAARNQ